MTEQLTLFKEMVKADTKKAVQTSAETLCAPITYTVYHHRRENNTFANTLAAAYTLLPVVVMGYLAYHGAGPVETSLSGSGTYAFEGLVTRIGIRAERFLGKKI